MSSGEDIKQQPATQEAPNSSAQQSDPKAAATAPAKTESDEKPTTAAPLAPPPKPSQQNHQPSQPQQTPDYFGGGQNSFSLEPNPFEQSFGQPPSGETPNKLGGLPGVTSLTSPAPLGPRGTPGNWPESMRSGPLSPAMLQGPVAQSNNNPGYFDQEFRNNYPTPNESSLRTGLTPGGGGSMFPAPSPNTQALFNNLNGGQPTPGTAEFQRAAAAARKPEQSNGAANGQNMSKQEYQPAQQQGRPETFQNQQESEAVNSLYMLAQPNARQGANANQFAMPNQQQQMANMNLQQRMAAQQQQQQQKQSPTQHRKNSSIDMSGGDQDDGEDEKPARGKGKKGAAAKGGQAANGRRKADETPAKGPAKKRKANNGGVNPIDMDDDDDSDDAASIKDENGNQLNANGRKMTDDEKRKNFLERNRVAALKCRQRKKQWLANLQTKVEIFTQENDALNTQCGQLREELINLKTLLLAHKDCPVSHQQGLGGQNMAQFMGDPGHGGYGMVGQGGMHMPNMGGQSMQQGMQQQQGVQRS